ncbi:hypothetical protein [Winogradskya consettensis]|uniref:hypothetical protein n=1 Tax=Winogradskya consettensis TaxID=113560 RepID=UPI002455FFAA|nr:hypothetical protein [Actinoplanes consettensis]
MWFAVPPGYASLPLENIPETIEITGKLLGELGTPQLRESGDFVLEALRTFLRTLADRRAVYCGVGRHRSAINDQLISSSLVVTLLEFPDESNPRLVLANLLEAKADADDVGQPDLVDLVNGPAMFFERTVMMPAPAIPGQHVLAEGVESPVWQLEAFVPSPQGDKLATIEVSTSFAEHGPQYRAMLVAMASGVVFEEPVDSDPLAALLG